MKSKPHMTAFYIETLLMILVFVGIILSLTQVFGASRNESADAKTLTSAVCLAQNAAEAFAAAEKPEDLTVILDKDKKGHIQLESEGESKSLTASYRMDMTPDPDGGLKLHMTWQEREGLLYAYIEILQDDQSIYTLDTAGAGKEGW